jgi:hypothetical protein
MDATDLKNVESVKGMYKSHLKLTPSSWVYVAIQFDLMKLT